ncbi:MAG: glycosyltransferase, partial [Patescibacteria group bacterium]|nr:glycosyltransferase [Patescibacteria group bacterium]
LGNGSLEKQLRAEISRRNLDAYVELPGWQESLSYMKVTDLLLATSYYEGYGRQIIEALAAGVPVLSTDVGVAREAGAIVTTEKDFVDALNKWFTNGPRTAELTNYPYQSFEEYVEKYCADIEAAVTLI